MAKAWQEQVKRGIISTLEARLKSLEKELSDYVVRFDDSGILVRDMIAAKIVDLKAEIAKLIKA